MRLIRWLSILIAFALAVREEMSSSSSRLSTCATAPSASPSFFSSFALLLPFEDFLSFGLDASPVCPPGTAVAFPPPLATKSTPIISASPVSTSKFSSRKRISVCSPICSW